MKTFTIIVTQTNGLQCGYTGIFSTGFDAVIHAMDNFPTATRISARRLP
jgi:hypothetical protein